MAIADELKYRGFWHTEDHIRRAVDMFIERSWRKGIPGRPSPPLVMHAPSGDSLDLYSNASTASTGTIHLRTVEINLPDSLDERTARLFAEIQLHEQLDPTYDPTEADT
jgi:hypothetical protein